MVADLAFDGTRIAEIESEGEKARIFAAKVKVLFVSRIMMERHAKDFDVALPMEFTIL